MPGVRASGCFFHFRKALRMNLGKEGKIKKLQTDSKFRHWFNCLAALAFVPEDDVKPLLDLMITKPDFPEGIYSSLPNFINIYVTIYIYLHLLTFTYIY